MTLTRRRLLASLLGAAAALPLAALFPGRAASAAPRQGFFLVNGWVLTAADLQALGIEDPGPRIA